jgi:hypothetical protein
VTAGAPNSVVVTTHCVRAGMDETQEHTATPADDTWRTDSPQAPMTQTAAEFWMAATLLHWHAKSVETHPTAEPAERRHDDAQDGMAEADAEQEE